MDNLKRSILGMAVMVTALSVFATNAIAQSGRRQINLQASGVIITDSEGGGLRNEATKSGGFLVGYSHQFHRWAGFEANYGYTRDSHRYPGVAGPISIRSNIHQVTGAFVAHVPAEGVIKPYALAGGGALIFDPLDDVSLAFSDRQARATFLYGGGANFDLTHNFGIRAEYRGFVYKTPSFKNQQLNLDAFTHLAQPSAGIFFRF